MLDLSGDSVDYYYHVISASDVANAEHQLQTQGDIQYLLSMFETMGAQNNLRVRDPEGKEFLVPNVPAFVVKVDLEEKKIVIRRIEGLL